MMPKKQVFRVAKSLIDLLSNECRVDNIVTHMVPSAEDPDFLDPVVVITYRRRYEYDEDQAEHIVKVFCDGSMSDF